jgi:hypothetical protein
VRLEHIPIIVGVLVALFGVGLLYDAIASDYSLVARERRRRPRAERNRLGEGAVAIGTLCMAAALIGRDVWRYGTLTVFVGAALLVLGTILNWRYLGEIMTLSGPARRVPEGDQAVGRGEPRNPANVK